MKKKILIGSMLVLVMLLLMPSIPAVQQKTIEDKAYSDFVEELKNVDYDDIKELDWIRHPILYSFVMLFIYCNILRFNFYFELCLRTYESGYQGSIDIIYPLLFFIFGVKWVMIEYKTMEWIYFWNYISKTFGWNWELP